MGCGASKKKAKSQVKDEAVSEKKYIIEKKEEEIQPERRQPEIQPENPPAPVSEFPEFNDAEIERFPWKRSLTPGKTVQETRKKSQFYNETDFKSKLQAPEADGGNSESESNNSSSLEEEVIDKPELNAIAPEESSFENID